MFTVAGADLLPNVYRLSASNFNLFVTHGFALYSPHVVPLFVHLNLFLGGKKCHSCSNRIYHDKWSITPEVAEARWAHKEAKDRELDEVIDFLN